MKNIRFAMGLAVLGLGLWAAAAASFPPDAAAVYPLKRLKPAGFGIFKGVLDWVPVSAKAGVAFAANYDKGSDAVSLTSFKIGGAGVASPARTIAENKGWPWAAACVWIEDGAAARDGASPFGYVFVLFEVYVSQPWSETASVWMARFDAEGKVLGDWTEILKVKTPAGRNISADSLYAFSRGSSVGVVPSLSYSDRQGQRKSLAYFIEIESAAGTVIGAPGLLPLPQNGDYIDAWGLAPAWSGVSWLVPVSAVLYKSPGREADIFGKKALVYAVSADAAHAAVARTVASDMTRGWGLYGDMELAPFPGSASDQALFLKQEKLIPEPQRKLDMLKYVFSLIRLDATGSVVKKRTLAVPPLTHRLVYDPAAALGYPSDYWSTPVAKDGRLYLSRSHSTSDWKKSGSGRNDGSVERYEQQYGLYVIDTATGTVTLKAETATLLAKALCMPPVLRPFPPGSLSVINSIWYHTTDYPRWSYFSKLGY